MKTVFMLNGTFLVASLTYKKRGWVKEPCGRWWGMTFTSAMLFTGQWVMRWKPTALVLQVRFRWFLPLNDLWYGIKMMINYSIVLVNSHRHCTSKKPSSIWIQILWQYWCHCPSQKIEKKFGRFFERPHQKIVYVSLFYLKWKWHIHKEVVFNHFNSINLLLLSTLITMFCNTPAKLVWIIIFMGCNWNSVYWTGVA